MTTNTDNQDYSDDEVFIGKLTLKEVKKRVMMDYHRHSLSYTKTKMKCSVSSAEIIETIDSEPELKPISLDDSSFSLCSSSEDKITNTCDNTSDEHSFLEKEKMVSELLLVDKKDELLNNALSSEHSHMVNCEIEETSKDHSANNLQDTEIDSERSQSPIEMLEIANVKCYLNIDCTTSIKEEHLSNNFKSALAVARSSSKTTSNTQNNIYLSSANINVEQTSVFKTPKAAGLFKKHVQTHKNTPKCKLYEHIASPVAAYIKNGTNKPLSEISSIPKPIKIRKKK